MSVAQRETKLAAERANLFRAAWAVLKRSGYANATITDILNEAEISTRAFYRHFASKDDLLLAMFAENAEVTAARVATRVRAAGSPREQIEAWIDVILDMAYDARTRTSARMFASPAVRGLFDEAGQAAIAQLYEPLRDVLAAGVESGEIRTAEPAQDAESIHAITWRVFLDQTQGRSALTREQAGAHVRRFVLPALGFATG